MKGQLEELKKKCKLRRAKCCHTCYHFESYAEDFGSNYQQYCSCPENEGASAKPGEPVFFEVMDYDVCDHWQGMDANGNPSRDIIRIEAEPRYPEDAEVNDVEEDNDNPTMPFLTKQAGTRDEWLWKFDIDIKTGEIIGWPLDVKAKTHYKVCDCCGIKYGDKKYRDYVPDFLSLDCDGYGDYITITIEGGKIKNWNEALCRDFIKWLDKQGEE